MRAVLLIAMLSGACAAVVAGAPTLPLPPRIAFGDAAELMERLSQLADERLRPAGLSVDRRQARLLLAGPGGRTVSPAGGEAEVRPLWSAGSPLPMRFELRLAGADAPVTATLAAPLLRDVWAATRRLAKGSAVACTDLAVQRRDVRQVPASPLPSPCTLAPGAVARRDVAAGDLVRVADFGDAPAVAAGSTVRVDVQVAGIGVSAHGVALADAGVGEVVGVRLQRPLRSLDARVIAPGRVELTEGSR